MTEKYDSARQPHPDPPVGEVLETDSGRKPIWGIVALIGFLAFAGVAVWRVNTGDSNPTPSYSSSVSTTTIASEGKNGAGITGANPPRRSSTAARIFFFALVGTMALVAARIILRARQIYRATGRRASKSSDATLH